MTSAVIEKQCGLFRLPSGAQLQLACSEHGGVRSKPQRLEIRDWGGFHCSQAQCTLESQLHESWCSEKVGLPKLASQTAVITFWDNLKSTEQITQYFYETFVFLSMYLGL